MDKEEEQPNNGSQEENKPEKQPEMPGADGALKRPVKHNRKRRAAFHRYDQPGTYLITIAIEGRYQLFGNLQTGDFPKIQLSDLGCRIRDDELRKIRQTYPMAEVWDYCIMPDHIHLILRITEKLPPNKHLGNVIGGFKGGCSRAWWDICGYTDSADRKPLFEKGYNDGILLEDGQLENWHRYILDNPRRLALKRANPDLFKIWHNVDIGHWQCQMIGSIFLLNYPDIMAVIVHRVDSDEDFSRKFDAWMACGHRGGVLVSAAIAPREKMVMREALNRGYRMIVLRENGFHKYYKPAGESFDACVRGDMLQICPWNYHEESRTISREQCMILNDLAIHISSGR